MVMMMKVIMYLYVCSFNNLQYKFKLLAMLSLNLINVGEMNCGIN